MRAKRRQHLNLSRVAASTDSLTMSLGQQIFESVKASIDEGAMGGFIVTVPSNRQAAYAAVYLSSNGIPATFITR
jgi:hypothetical protein